MSELPIIVVIVISMVYVVLGYRSSKEVMPLYFSRWTWLNIYQFNGTRYIGVKKVKVYVSNDGVVSLFKDGHIDVGSVDMQKMTLSYKGKIWDIKGRTILPFKIPITAFYSLTQEFLVIEVISSGRP